MVSSCRRSGLFKVGVLRELLVQTLPQNAGVISASPVEGPPANALVINTPRPPTPPGLSPLLQLISSTVQMSSPTEMLADFDSGTEGVVLSDGNCAIQIPVGNVQELGLQLTRGLEHPEESLQQALPPEP